MNKSKLALLELLRIGATGECLFTENLFNVNWDDVVRLVTTQGVASLCMKGLEVLYAHEIDICPAEQKLTLYALRQQTENEAKNNWLQCTEFAEAIRPVRIAVLKGIDYARYWPNPLWREFGDLDCYAADGFTEAVENRANDIGLTIEESGYKHSIIRYKGLTIENHHFFSSCAGSREAARLEKMLHELWRNDDLKEIEGTSLLSPNSDFTAIFLIAHAQNHFFYEGMSLRMILDWLFFLQKENVDWEKVSHILSTTGLQPFTEVMTSVCIKHFGMDENLCPCRCEDNMVIDAFVEDIFSDKYDVHDRRWWMIISRMLHRYNRMWKFRCLMRMPVYKAVWRSVAYSSFFHRKPVL